jgi:acyl-CoA synthetase (AMP-forming)/AMP-acid ligase II
MGLDLLLTDAEGAALPDQRNVVGHLKVKGQSVGANAISARPSRPSTPTAGSTPATWRSSTTRALTLAGRSKDLIKSGGEWINPVEIEEIVGALPSVGLVAVIGRADPKWGERPLMVIEPAQGTADRRRRAEGRSEGAGRRLVDSLNRSSGSRPCLWRPRERSTRRASRHLWRRIG